MATGTQEDLLRRIRLIEKFTGSVTASSAPPLTGLLQAANNLSDLVDLATARQNLEQDTSGALISIARTGPPKNAQYAQRAFNVALGLAVQGAPVNSQSATPVIECIFGDSLTGNFVSNPNQTAWPAIYEAEMAKRFNALERTMGTVGPIFGDGLGIYPNQTVFTTYNGAALSPTNNPVGHRSGGVVVLNNVGPNTAGAQLTGSDTLVFSGYGDGLIAYFTAHSAGSGLGGTCNIQIVGPGGTTNTSVVTQAGSVASNTSAIRQSIAAPGGIQGTLTVTFSRTGGGTHVDLDFVVLTNGNRTSGYQQHSVGLGGTKFTDWTSGTTLATNFQQYLTNVQPQFLTFCLGTNDYAFEFITADTFATRFTALIAAIRAQYTVPPALRFIFEPQTQLTANADWANSYRAAARQVCETDGNIAFVDFSELSGGWTTATDPYSQAPIDHIHPDEPTHYAWGLAIADMTLAALPNASQLQNRFTTITSQTLPSSGGKWAAGDGGIIGPFAALYGSAADTVAKATLLTDGLHLGPGGSTAADVTITRSGVGTASLLGSWRVGDGTAGHGQVLLSYVSTLGSAVAIFNNTADTVATLTLLNTGMFLGPGGSTASDCNIQRTGTGIITATGAFINDKGDLEVHDSGTAAHGKHALTANAFGAVYNLYTTDGDTTASLQLLANTLKFGPGGSTALDWTLARTGTAAATVTGALTVYDGTAGDGSIQLLAAAPFGTITGVYVRGASGDTQAVASLLTVGTTGQLNFGPGGSTATDCQISRSGSAAMSMTGSLLGNSSIKTSAATGGVGYATGAGGTASQSTSKSTAFPTISKTCGTLTWNNAALASDTTVTTGSSTNAAIAATDTVVFTHISGGTLGAYNMTCTPGAGSWTLTLRNLHSGSLSEAPVFAFSIIKAVTS